MAAAMKLLLLSALLKMGACQGGTGNCVVTNGKTYATMTTTPLLKTECWELQCYDGKWYPITFKAGCGDCYFGGEPLVYTFDTLKTSPAYGSVISNLISVDGDGEYVMVQPGLDNLLKSSPNPAFGVTGHFTDERQDPLGEYEYFCGNTSYTNCVDGLIYYESSSSPKYDIAVKLVLQYTGAEFPNPRRKIDVYTSATAAARWGAGPWTGPITIPPGGLLLPSTLTGDTGIFVFEAAFIPGPGGGKDCTILIGTKGISVALCAESTRLAPYGYPWAYVYAMPDLKSTAAYPNKGPGNTADDRLYGLCNSWTNAPLQNPRCFYKGPYKGGASGDCKEWWQMGTTQIHGSTDTYRKLRNGIAKTWKMP